MFDAHNYRVAETLRDGLTVTIRAVRSDDKARLIKTFAGLERETVYKRLFSYQRELSPAQLARLDTMDLVEQVMLVVTIPCGDDETIIGGGSYVVHEIGDGVRSAEVSFTVEEDFQGRGIASRVLGHLTKLARANGIVRFDAEVLTINGSMLGVFERSGLPCTQRMDGDTVHVTMALAEVATP